MSLTGCGGGLHRTYYYETDRYDETKSGGVLLVSPGEQMVNATSVVNETEIPPIMSSQDWTLVGKEGWKPEPPSHELWKSDPADWDTSGYEVVTEPGGCKPYGLSITMAHLRTPNEPKRSCWNLLWDIPAGLLLDAFVVSLILAKLSLMG
jgi:hypothetical protein